jgi:predicted permease
MEAHIAHRVDDLVTEGMDPVEAERRARAEFGDLERLHRETVQAGGRADRRSGLTGFLDALRQDLGFAARQLRRNPGFAAVAVATIAVGIAATATVVGVVRAVVLEPLPFHEPGRLVQVQAVSPAQDPFSVSEPAYLDWREQTRSFTDVAAAAFRTGILQSGDEPVSVGTLWASASMLTVLGVEPALGRNFLAEEDAAGAPAAVTILSDRLWREAFGADPGVVGTDVVLNGEAHRVVGVLPPDLPYVDQAGVLVPLGADRATDRDEHYLDVLARLAPGATVADAGREMRQLADRLGQAWPADREWSAMVTPLREVLIGPELTRAGWVLLAAAGVLLLIACVNVSNLLLARATVRRAEIGVRVALGAGRSRIVRQLFTESAALAALGALAGLGLTRLALPAVRTMGAGRIPRLDQATLGPDVVLACAAAAAAATLLFGLAPALRVRRDATAGSLRSGGRGGSHGRGGRGLLVAGQVGLSVVLLVGTGLLVRSFVRLASVDPGFEAEGTLAVRLTMPQETYDPEQRRALMESLLEEVRAVPGIRAAGAIVVDPFGGLNLMNSIARSDRMPAEAPDFPATAWRIVTPGFTEAMGVELLAGRSFESTDGWDGGTPVVVNRALIRRLWSGPDGPIQPGDAVGATLVWGDPDGSRLRVVGVVEDVRDLRLDDEPMPVVYRPYNQIPWTFMTLVARTDGRGDRLVGGFRAAIRRAGPGLAVPEVRSLGDNLGDAVATPRFHALLLGVFAASGLALAAVGVYGVTAFDVSRRFREIGIRLAVGGSPVGVRRLILADSLRLALLGAVGGALVAWIGGRWLESILYRTTVGDPVTWAVVVGVLGVVSLVAAWIPSRRATRVVPRDVLTGE